MDEASVPTLPSVELSPDVSAGDLKKAAESIGYPALVKASAGGGGKGMRVVETEDELQAAIEGARREAAASFGDDTIFLERWLRGARHVEIQVLGDQSGNVVHCFERECSIQRRHQKVIEEAPSPAVSAELRERMGAAAVAAGKAIGYTSAGTVEFLLAEDGEFYFLEMNTRLQVEHPVTEEVSGLDLVREQLRIAQGEALGYEQKDLTLSGHAIEARLYAEDAANDFLPSTGTLRHWQPSGVAEARYDSGVESGSEIGIEFDPMLAKVIVHAPTRSEAARRLARVLATTEIHGLTTNRDFLVATLETPEFLAGDTTTDFIERVAPPATRQASDLELVEAAICVAMASQHERRQQVRVQTTIPSGWRNSDMPPEIVRFRCPSSGRQVITEYRIRRDGTFDAWTSVLRAAEEVDADELVEVERQAHLVELNGVDGRSIELTLDGQRISANHTSSGLEHWVNGPDGDVALVELPRFPAADREGIAGGLVAPMPGKVIAVEVAVGDAVEAGQLLLVLEAMKMEKSSHGARSWCRHRTACSCR